MKITYDEFRQYTQNAPRYSDGLIFVQSGIRKEDVLCMVMWLRRLCQVTDGLSFMLITSSCDSKDGKVRKKRIHSGKAGRPRTITEGTPTVNHIHGLLVSENQNADIKTFKKDLQKRRKKEEVRKKTVKLFARKFRKTSQM